MPLRALPWPPGVLPWRDAALSCRSLLREVLVGVPPLARNRLVRLPQREWRKRVRTVNRTYIQDPEMWAWRPNVPATWAAASKLLRGAQMRSWNRINQRSAPAAHASLHVRHLWSRPAPTCLCRCSICTDCLKAYAAMPAMILQQVMQQRLQWVSECGQEWCGPGYARAVVNPHCCPDCLSSRNIAAPTAAGSMTVQTSTAAPQCSQSDERRVALPPLGVSVEAASRRPDLCRGRRGRCSQRWTASSGGSAGSAQGPGSGTQTCQLASALFTYVQQLKHARCCTSGQASAAATAQAGGAGHRRRAAAAPSSRALTLGHVQVPAAAHAALCCRWRLAEGSRRKGAVAVGEWGALAGGPGR